MNLGTLSHSWVLSFAAYLGNRDPLLDGLNGGALLGRDPLTVAWVRDHGLRPPTPAEALDHARQQLFLRNRRRIKMWLTSSRLSGAVWREAERRFTDRFRLYLEYRNPFQAWIYLERTPYGIALSPYVLMGNDRVVCPYYTDDMIEFGLSLPWEFTCDATFQEDLMRRRYPHVAQVPYSHQLVASDSQEAIVDTDRERRSLSEILPHLRGHVADDWLERMAQPMVDRRGNRRMVLVAQALAWEKAGKPEPLMLS